MKMDLAVEKRTSPPKKAPYELKKLKLRDRLRSRSISRWHTVEISKEQSVAEHSHLVGVIAEHLLNELVSIEKISFQDRYILLKYAQIHDESEVILNDISSILKTYLKNKSADFGTIIEELELELTPELAITNAHFSINPHLKHIAKLADLLEALSFMSTCSGGDSQHNQVIFEKLNDLIDLRCRTATKECPDLEWELVIDIKHEIQHGDSVILDFESLLTP